MLSDYVIPALIILSFLFVTWYFLGMWMNRRRGIRLARALRERLSVLSAEDLAGRWVNSSIFQFTARRATTPIGKLAAILVLEARELPLIWLVSLLRGRRDLLVLRMNLRSTPAAGLELEACSARTRPEREARRRIAEGGWEQTNIGEYHVYHRSGAAHLVETLKPLLHEWQPGLRRLSISTTSPHLLLSFSPASAALETATQFHAIQKLAAAILERQSATRKQEKRS
ncbi:MAG: hypothetical protein IMW89_00840 [Ktedonobacteraceae bacterium]|nr:hypothetical protein [Ktedonobacteraceae bacterium]